MCTGKVTRLSAEGAAQLEEGISLVLSRWTALQDAIDNNFAGPHTRLKSQDLAPKIFSWFTQSKAILDIYDLEDTISGFLCSSLMLIPQDGSIEEVALKLMIMHEECLEGNFMSIQRLRETNPPRGSVPHTRQVLVVDSDDDDESVVDDNSSEMILDAPVVLSNASHMDMAVDEPRAKQTKEAEDGWTVVYNRRNRGDDISGVPNPEIPVAVSQDDLHDMAIGMRDVILEANAGLSEGLNNSIAGPLKEMQESQADLTRSIRDMLGLINEKSASLVGNSPNNDPPKMPGPQGFVLGGFQSSSSSSPVNIPKWPSFGITKEVCGCCFQGSIRVGCKRNIVLSLPS
ncbi:hypothetical protein RHMOL_Rhmol06G0018900 [Rhododendron molle]|uniref:Uncharacterized protein n=3 Tax=Rhododendron molle TaxID=49168 RepID=A0ACC0N8N5_RHOML|nr:hypothetical protein RHMOL_Rhmol06G0018900 [Rhododendron molle]KAI8549362.1 hypothetical protein RHMOL_Rhmol06G0018900 [Rhododendron molle]KAI8549363.1 hypothetical protein RHMOL_Rhmol06G0018900 [Rhododendron molle]